MILFLGIPSEPPMRLAIHAAERDGLPYLVLNQRRIAACEMAFGAGPHGIDGTLTIDGADHALSAFAGVYVRLMDVATLPEFSRGRGPRVATALAYERACGMYELLVEWLEVAPCRVASRPSAMASNTSKPYQAQLVERCGFATPPTLVTNDPHVVRAFAREYGNVVFKSVSGTRSIVRRLDTVATRRLERVRAVPTQFQAFIGGTDVRVHVVGDDVHATEIRSDAVDYRYAVRDGRSAVLRPHALPRTVADRCRAVARALELPFCGLDLRRTPGGEYVCFEANPMPAYGYYQQETGQPIAESLVRYLAGAERVVHGLGS